MNNLENEHALNVDDRDKAHAKIKYLEAELARISIKEENNNLEEIETLHEKVSELNLENLKYKEMCRLQTKEINELKSSLKVKNDISNQLNKKMNELKIRVEKESSATKKSNKAEIKSWRKELGEERKKKLKLEENIEQLKNKIKHNEGGEKDTKMIIEAEANMPVSDLHKTETFCSLCGASIPDFVPEYFCGEKYNPACLACKSCDSLWSLDDPYSSLLEIS